MDRARHIEDLADELISGILVFLLGSEQLSSGSFFANSQKLLVGSNGKVVYPFGEKSELDRFRLVCRRFMRISTPHKFSLFVLRFSREGFQRLEDLMDMQLACHVKHFTYMVRPFYQGSGWPSLLSGIDANTLPAARIHKRRFQDQRELLDSNRDFLILRRAITAFPSLQQVKLLRLQDEAHEKVLDYIRERSLEQTTGLDWDIACSRAVTSLGISLLESNCNSIRFIGGQISPDATVKLLHTPRTTLSKLGARMASLDITFHATNDMRTYMTSLSGVFYDFFLAARNLAVIHLAFPASRPLDLSLEHIFHGLKWKRLRTLSLEGWRLDSEEIISLIRRHRRQLRDVRLTSVYLREGSRWRDVLSVLHDEMDQLERICLRGINYTHRTVSSISSHGNGNGHGDAVLEGPVISIVTLPPVDLPSPRTALNVDYMSSEQRGNTRRSFTDDSLERIRHLTVNDLGDNGFTVRDDQRILWEAWVLSGKGASGRNRLI